MTRLTHMTRWIPFLAIAFLGSLSSYAATINGSVVADAAGSPLGGMTVAAYSSTGTFITSATSASNGLYSISIGAGSYRLVAWDPAGQFATSFFMNAPTFETSVILVLEAASVISADFRLVRNGWVTGTVTDASGSTGLASMTVAAYDSRGFRRGTTTSLAGGTYKLALPPDTYRIAAWDDTLQYAAEFYSNRTTYAAADPITVRPQETVSAIDFSLSKSATISGRVTSSTGAPLAGIVVEAWTGTDRAQQATTNASGAYQLRVPPTAIRLLAWDPAGVYATLFDGNASSFDATPTRYLVPEQTTGGVDFVLTRGGTIQGVIRSDGGMPLEGVTVAAFNADGTVRTKTTTSSAGIYSLLLPPGTFFIGAWDPTLTHLPRFHSGASRFETAAPLTVASGAVTSGIDFLLPLAARLTGTVTSKNDAAPLPGIEVFLYDVHGREVAKTRTAADGTFELAAEAGTYRVVVADPARVYATWYYDGARNFGSSATITLVAGTVLTIDANLSVGARLEGIIRNQVSSAPIEGARVSAWDAEGMLIAEAITGANGTFSILLAPGAYRIVATDSLHRYEPVWYENAASFAEATSVLVGAGIVRRFEFELVPLDAPRRRTVHRPAGTTEGSAAGRSVERGAFSIPAPACCRMKGRKEESLPH